MAESGLWTQIFSWSWAPSSTSILHFSNHFYVISKLIHPNPIPWLLLLDYGKASQKELSHKEWAWCRWGMSFKGICRVLQLTLCSQQLATQYNARHRCLALRGRTPAERPQPISADWGQREFTSKRWRQNHTETNLGNTTQFRWKGSRDHQRLPWGCWPSMGGVSAITIQAWWPRYIRPESFLMQRHMKQSASFGTISRKVLDQGQLDFFFF